MGFFQEAQKDIKSIVVSTTVKSKNKILIRLTNERFNHIIKSHPEILKSDYLTILKTIEKPDIIFAGYKKELSVAKRQKTKKRWFVVIYKEEAKDGFVITAYVTTDTRWLLKKKIIWSKKY